MAVTVSRVSGVQDTVFGNKRIKIRNLVFSSNYATGGEALAASDFGLDSLQFISFSGGVANAGDEATGNPISYDWTAGKVVFFEGSAAGTALSEKTNGEAYPSGSYTRAFAVGY